MKNKEKYLKSREAWQKANSYYKWYSLGKADCIINLSNDQEIDLYIEEKVANSIRKLKKKYCGEDLRVEIKNVMDLWQQAKILIKDNKEQIRSEINLITQAR